MTIKTWLGTDSGYREGRWRNARSGRIITGHYRWNRSSQRFSILIAPKQLRSGMKLSHISYDDEPNFGNWLFVKRSG